MLVGTGRPAGAPVVGGESEHAAARRPSTPHRNIDIDLIAAAMSTMRTVPRVGPRVRPAWSFELSAGDA